MQILIRIRKLKVDAATLITLYFLRFLAFFPYKGNLMVIFCRRYLHKLFTQLSKHKGKLKVRHLPIEDVTASLPHHLEVSRVGI
jgi:hypothetical protein